MNKQIYWWASIILTFVVGFICVAYKAYVLLRLLPVLLIVLLVVATVCAVITAPDNSSDDITKDSK